jgi:ketosteroid isomerase-like protein
MARSRLLRLTALTGLIVWPVVGSAQGAEQRVLAAVESYNRAFVGKDLAALKDLLAQDVVLYEHSVRNIGLDDVWENHLRPEVAAFEGTKADFTDVRVWVSNDLALVTRNYAITATMNGRAIDARGNETMGWALRDGAWKVVHIHYSHPCPRPAPPPNDN